MSANIATECPICMENIDSVCNRVVTECGHAFHCSCLMKNAAHNGFGCPYCRTVMAEQPEDSDSEDDDSDSEEETVFDEDALTSFRMFHQRINGEEIEEQEEDDDDWGTVDSEVEVEGEVLVSELPDSSYVAEKLLGRGITFEDLVKDALFNAHSNWGDHFSEYERRSSEVYGQFRAVITQFSPPTLPLPTLPLPTLPLPTLLPLPVPQIAEAKSVAMPRRRECMVHV